MASPFKEIQITSLHHQKIKEKSKN